MNLYSILKDRSVDERNIKSNKGFGFFLLISFNCLLLLISYVLFKNAFINGIGGIIILFSVVLSVVIQNYVLHFYSKVINISAKVKKGFDEGFVQSISLEDREIIDTFVLYTNGFFSFFFSPVLIISSVSFVVFIIKFYVNSYKGSQDLLECFVYFLVNFMFFLLFFIFLYMYYFLILKFSILDNTFEILKIKKIVEKIEKEKAL